MKSRCRNCNGCIDCKKNVVKSPWDKCLTSQNACLNTPKLNFNNVISPHPSHQSDKMRTAQIIKPKGLTVYGRWRRAKYDKKTKKYIFY